MEIMKKTAIYTLVVAFVFMATASITFAAKPDNNKAGAQKVDWNLSADVMPVPPYGSGDIEGSDTASKLIVNQPNGKVDANITGVMKGLNPDTTYTVYLSKGYIPYEYTGWNVIGDWVLEFDYLGALYIHDMTITDNTFTGTGGYHTGGLYTIEWTVAGTIDGDNIEMRIDYNSSSYYVDVVGVIASDGTMSGTWSNVSQSGEWESTSGIATETHTGNTGWSGLLTGEIQPFTFATDSEGSGSWHINVKEGVTTADEFSVWINGSGRTILISDNVSL